MLTTKIEFDKIPAEIGQPYLIGSLVLDMKERLGKWAFLDLTNKTPHPALAADLIAALGRHALFNLKSDLSFRNYTSLISRVLDFAAQVGLSTKIRLADFDTELILLFRKHIKERLESQKNATYTRLYGNFNRLLQAARALGLFERATRVPRNFRHVDDSKVSNPYNYAEQLDLEEVCRRCIDEMFARLQRGRELLAIGSNPRGVKNGTNCPPENRAWNKLENLIWYATHIHEELPPRFSALKEMKDYSYINAVYGVYGGTYRMRDIHSHRYALVEDLIPFFILIAKRTGRNESSLLTLKRNCLQEIDGKYYLIYRKLRSAEREFKKKIEDDGPYSAVSLIRKLLNLTAPLVKHAPPGDKDLLFLGLTLHTSKSSVKAIDPVYFKYQMNHNRGWCKKNNLLNDMGETFQISAVRLRVTYLTRKYIKHGQLSKISQDAVHSLADTSVGYIANASTKLIHEQAVRDGIKSSIAAIKKPTVLPIDDPTSAAKELNKAPNEAKAILRGEVDVLFNACKDIMNRPGGPPHTFCDRPWSCFGCGNTVITRHVLPRVFGFLNHAESMKVSLGVEEWKELFSRSVNLIHADVLPRFSDSVLKIAQARASTQRFYIPIALKGNL